MKKKAYIRMITNYGPLNIELHSDMVSSSFSRLSVPQIRRGNRDNLGIISHISPLKHIL